MGVGLVLAPGVVPVVVGAGLNPLLSWFRPEGSNVAIGMFFVMAIVGSGLAAYLFGLLVGYPYVRRWREEGRLSLWRVVKGTWIAGVGFAAFEALIPLVSGALALAGAIVVTVMAAFTLAAVCFYGIASAVSVQTVWCPVP
jgi:hypothetical protein